MPQRLERFALAVVLASTLQPALAQEAPPPMPVTVVTLAAKALHLSTDLRRQVRAYREMNMDVYSCIALAGPPPNNVILTIIVPKDTPTNFKFDDRCRLQ